VVDIAFGSGLHVVALTTSGKLYSWGNNSYGQLGHNSVSSSDPVPIPLPVAISQRVVKVACGGHHTLAVAEDGGVSKGGVGVGLGGGGARYRCIGSILVCMCRCIG